MATMTIEEHELEPPTRLSRSLLWQLQRASYRVQGLQAWRPGGVPYQITSNPFIARAYADVIAGLLLDLQASATPPRRPVQIVELGAGSGRFGFYLLRALTARLAREPAPARPWFRLVMTDLALANLDGWLAHPRLRPFIDQGLLDVAVFDAERPAPLRLRVAGDVLAPDDDGEPVVAIANYVFDSIPYDAYQVEGGELRECRVALIGAGDREAALRDPAAALEAASWRVELAPAELDHADPLVNELCAEYAHGPDGSIVLVPVAGLATVDYLARLGGGRLLTLTSDKGYRDPAQRAAHADFTIATHGGCVSLSVNFHAFARYVERRGGFALPADQRHDGFYSGVLGLGLDASALPRCLAAVDELARFGPGDYQRLIDHTAAETRQPSVEHVLGLLRLASWDPRLLTRFAAALIDGMVDRAPSGLDADLAEALTRVRDLLYPLPGVRDPALVVIGTLWLALRQPADAIAALEAALDGTDADAPTHALLARARALALALAPA